MESFVVSISTVGIAEMGDRTQLLSLMLAARYRKPWTILAGVLCASLVSHAAAGVIGARLGQFLTPNLVDGIVGVSMIGMALWTLKPDTLEAQAAGEHRTSAFVTTAVAFFIAEMGDKTQVATAALAAGYSNLLAVIGGTTAGTLLANVPAVFAGKAFCERLPLQAIQRAASVLFAVLGAVFLARALWYAN